MAIEFANTDSAIAEVKKTSEISFSFNKKVTTNDRKFFTEQLALLLETGNSLSDSLEIIRDQNDSGVLSIIIEDVISQISDGKSFSSALSQHPDVFSKTYITLISASESGGYMHKVLEHILDMEKKREDLISTLSSAFTYPLFLIAFALIVIIFILTNVFPKFTDLFAKIENELPSTTIILMWLSDVVRQYWWLLLGLCISIIAGLSSLYRSSKGKQLINDFISHIPVLGNVLYEIYLIQTMRIIGLSLNNGVTLVDAIQACKDIVHNSRYLEFINKLQENITEGKKFVVAFNETAFIPPLIQQMVKTGEESGKLALVCSRIADHYQLDLSRKLKSLSKMIEPIMLLLMGIVVGLIVSSLILPIFKLSRAAY